MMDAKEIKNTLKNARESIRKKEFKDALKHCKSVLSEDGSNYMALVLVAVSAEGLEQCDQARNAYKRAITADDSQILAWQGLCSFYEKNSSPVYRDDHVDVYIKLVQLHSGDKDKKFDTLYKLGGLIMDVTDKERIQKVADLYHTAIREEADVGRKRQLQQRLITILQLSQQSADTDQLCDLCKDVLEAAEYNPDTEAVISTYLTLLAKKPDSEFCATCTSLQQRFPQSTAALEYVVICHLDTNIGAFELIQAEELASILKLLETMLEDTGSPILTAARGFVALCERDYTKGRQLFSEVINQSTKLVFVYYYQSVTCLRLHQNEAAQKYCLDGIKLVERKDRMLIQSSTGVLRAFHYVRVMALYSQGDRQSLDTAVKALDTELTGYSDDVKVLQGLVYLKLGEVDKAKLCVVGESVQKMVLEGLLAAQEQNFTAASAKFEVAMEMDPSNSSHYVNLAKCLWKSADGKQQCYMVLLKAAKLDPHNTETFLYLGHYYNESGRDETRARKCYQKSFDLDPHNDEAGEALCDLLNQAGEEGLAHNILSNVTSHASAGCAKWAWLRLGLYQVKHEDPSAAIASFQSALRADPRDNHVWECLGEGYLARGSYTASLKAFNKASELDSDSMYSLFQMASIKQTLGTYTEAIDEYEAILDKSPNYVPALKGIGETYLLVAKSLLNKCFHGRARDTSQLAITHLSRAALLRPDLSCVWKLIGDGCTILHVLPADNFVFHKPDKTPMTKLETLELGAGCYVKALKILPECSSLWHDLGVNFIHQSECSTGETVTSLAERSVQALKKAIQLEPTNHRHWNALGYVACLQGYYQPSLAQHCFIKSIEVEHNNVIAWTNLAALYLKNDNVKLAHQAFKIAQSLEPSYVSCWIGQAIIAEVVGHEEAMDLFRHTTELGNHVEGALGYSHWVCTMLQDRDAHHSSLFTYAIEKMAAIPAASDALARYTDRVKTNAVAYNMYGLLLERQKLYATAAEQFKNAITLLESGGAGSIHMFDVMCNYARVLCKHGDYERSAAVFEDLGDLTNFADLCQMGLAFYKTNKLEVSFKAYTKAAELAETEEDKSHVLAAIAMVYYKFGDKDTTKTTLFQSSQMSAPSISGLKALCALGLLQSDVTLAAAVLQELFSVGDTDDDIHDVAFLAVAVNMLQRNYPEQSRLIQRLLHKNPDQPKLWQLLSTILLRFNPHLGAAISQTAKSSVAMDKHSSSKTAHVLIAAGDLSAGYHSNTTQTHNALKSAQVAVHLYPENIKNWVTLVACLHAEAMFTATNDRRVALLEDEYTMLKFILTKDNLQLDLKLWCHKQKVICTIHSGNQGNTLDSLDGLMTDFGGDKDAKQCFEVFKNVLHGNTEALATVIGNTPSSYYWQILVDMYMKNGLMTEVESTLKYCLRNTGINGDSIKLANLVKLAHVTFQQIIKGTGDSDHLKQVFNSTVEQVLLFHPDSTAVFVMQGILNIKENSRLAKHQMQKALDCPVTVSRGYDFSIARRALIYILTKSKKDNDVLEKIVADATECGDQETLQYYEKLKSLTQ